MPYLHNARIQSQYINFFILFMQNYGKPPYFDAVSWHYAQPLAKHSPAERKNRDDVSIAPSPQNCYIIIGTTQYMVFTIEIISGFQPGDIRVHTDIIPKGYHLRKAQISLKKTECQWHSVFLCINRLLRSYALSSPDAKQLHPACRRGSRQPT